MASNQYQIIYYDGKCAFCEKYVRLLCTLLFLRSARMLPIQSDPSVYADANRHNSWLVEDGYGNRSFGFAAGVVLVACSPIFFWTAPLLRVPLVSSWGEHLYRAVANRRTCAA